MGKKIVNAEFNISGLSAYRIFRQFRLYLKMPYVAIAEGPGYDCIVQLFKLHTLGRLMVYLEIHHPSVYKWLTRVRNSLLFRYNHYKKTINKKLKSH